MILLIIPYIYVWSDLGPRQPFANIGTTLILLRHVLNSEYFGIAHAYIAETLKGK